VSETRDSDEDFVNRHKKSTIIVRNRRSSSHEDSFPFLIGLVFEIFIVFRHLILQVVYDFLIAYNLSFQVFQLLPQIIDSLIGLS